MGAEACDRAPQTGRWITPDGERLTVERSNGHLALRWKDVRYRMVQVDPRAFYAPGADLIVGVGAGGADGRTRLYVSSNLDERWGGRAR